MSPGGFPWRTALLASVALNLLAAGAVVGALSAGVRVEREAPAALVERMPGPRAFLAALPEGVRPGVRREMARSWIESRQLRAAAREARLEAFALAAAEPFDAEQVSAAFMRVRAADQAAVGVFHDNVIAALAALPAEDRRRAIESMRRAPPAARGEGVGGAPDEDEAEAAPPARSGGDLSEERRRRREERRERRRQRLEQQP